MVSKHLLENVINKNDNVTCYDLLSKIQILCITKYKKWKRIEKKVKITILSPTKAKEMFVTVSVSYGTQVADGDSNIIFFISMPHPIKIARKLKFVLVTV